MQIPQASRDKTTEQSDIENIYCVFRDILIMSRNILESSQCRQPQPGKEGSGG